MIGWDRMYNNLNGRLVDVDEEGERDGDGNLGEERGEKD